MYMYVFSGLINSYKSLQYFSYVYAIVVPIRLQYTNTNSTWQKYYKRVPQHLNIKNKYLIIDYVCLFQTYKYL